MRTNFAVDEFVSDIRFITRDRSGQAFFFLCLTTGIGSDPTVPKFVPT